MNLLIIFIKIIMSESEEVLQRRREKILSRASTDTQDEDPPASPIQGNVFDRYKMLKEREENQKRLINISRKAGLLIYPLSYLIAPWLAFSLFTLVLLFKAYSLTRNSEQGGKEFDWLTGKVPLLGKLKHLDRVVLMGKIVLNTLLSFVMATVLINAAFLLYHDHFHIASTPIVPEAAVEL